MARTNLTARRADTTTFEGGRARTTTQKEDLLRIALTSMLWEDTFYEKGHESAARLKAAVHACDPREAAEAASLSRNQFKLRHVPLLIARELCRHPRGKEIIVSEVINHIIQRADELAEFVSLYWLENRQPLSAQAKKGLAKAFTKFDAYQLAKYNRDNAVKLRDVLFLCHAKPKDKEQATVWEKLVDGTLESPDTWEVALSKGGDKTKEWDRLLKEKRLGGMAIIRNLRNMRGAGVSEQLIKDSIRGGNYKRVLPFRFIAAAKYNPTLEPELEVAMLRAAEGFDKLPGKTVMVVDISGSMDMGQVSSRSEMTRADAAIGVAILAREMCDDIGVVAFHNDVFLVPARRGFALRDAIRSCGSGGTYLGAAIKEAAKAFPDYERMVVLTDEQAHDRVSLPSEPRKRHYLVNVASYNKTVDFGGWVKINGFSEAILQFIQEHEKLSAM